MTYNKFYPKRFTSKSSREHKEKSLRKPVPNVSFENLRKDVQIVTTPSKLKLYAHNMTGRGFSQDKTKKIFNTNKITTDSLELFNPNRSVMEKTTFLQPNSGYRKTADIATERVRFSYDNRRENLNNFSSYDKSKIEINDDHSIQSLKRSLIFREGTSPK